MERGSVSSMWPPPELMSQRISGRDEATGLDGTSLGSEFETPDGSVLEVATNEAAVAVVNIEHNGVLQSCFSVHIFVAFT